MNTLDKLTELSTIAVSSIIVGGAILSIMWILLVNKMKNTVLKDYPSKDYISNNFYNKDEVHEHFVSREKFDDIFRPYAKKIDDLQSGVRQLGEKIDMFLISFKNQN